MNLVNQLTDKRTFFNSLFSLHEKFSEGIQNIYFERDNPYIIDRSYIKLLSIQAIKVSGLVKLSKKSKKTVAKHRFR